MDWRQIFGVRFWMQRKSKASTQISAAEPEAFTSISYEEVAAILKGNRRFRARFNIFEARVVGCRNSDTDFFVEVDSMNGLQLLGGRKSLMGTPARIGDRIVISLPDDHGALQIWPRKGPVGRLFRHLRRDHENG